MIKVNLLAANPGAPAPRVWLPPEQRSAITGLALLVVTAAAVGGLWFYQHKQGVAIDRRTAAIQAELVRLKVEAKLVDETLAKKAELTERLDLIERLRLEKRAPVSLLQTVSQSVTDGLWLIEIKQVGANVQVDGRAMTTSSVTDFAKRLQDSGLFQRPVEVLTVTEQVEDTQVVHFTMKAESAHAAAPDTDAEPAAQPAAKTGAAAEAAAGHANTGA